MNWIALFSHTGSEIANISRRLTHWPDGIITNRPPGSKLDKNITRELMHTSSKPSVREYRDMLSGADLVTLHGWMRIIPKKICEEFNIYNLHPGLITEYPELKGKDPQFRVTDTINTYDKVGCVIHKVTPEVDCGEIIMTRSVNNRYYSDEAVVSALHEIAGDMWMDFLIDRV